MKIKPLAQIILVVAFLAAYPPSLPAGERPTLNDQKAAVSPVGRFLMVVVPGTANVKPEIYRFDTATGKTWKLTLLVVADDKGEPTEGEFEGWVEVDENPAQKALEWQAQKKENLSRPRSDAKKQPNQTPETTAPSGCGSP